MDELSRLKFPIGEFRCPKTVDQNQLNGWIESLETFPSQLENHTKNLSPEQLELTYRPGGWTVRQVIHHLADSHCNAYIRIKLTLTEELPIIRPYQEDRWAELPDGKSGDINLSIDIIKAIHARMVTTLKALDASQFERRYIHPVFSQPFTLAFLTGNYAWHGQHHLAHILSAIEPKK